jgi:hypothetical protein
MREEETRCGVDEQYSEGSLCDGAIPRGYEIHWHTGPWCPPRNVGKRSVLVMDHPHPRRLATQRSPERWAAERRSLHGLRHHR